VPDWLAEQLRISLFSNGAIPLSEADWQAITGQAEAETRTAIGGGKAYTGKFANGQFSIAHSGNRLDASLTPRSDVDDGSLKLPVIGNWNNVLPPFVDAVGKWIATAKFSIVRIAFGGVLNSEAPTREQAYEKLAGLLRSVTVDPAMKEVVFRCNWDRNSKVKRGLLLNRITVWSVIRYAHTLLQVTGNTVEVSRGDAKEMQAVRLEFDINTDQANTTPFDPGECIPILNELVALAQRNTEVGEER
jgi:hypothetical protein